MNLWKASSWFQTVVWRARYGETVLESARPTFEAENACVIVDATATYDNPPKETCGQDNAQSHERCLVTLVGNWESDERRVVF